MQNKVSNAIWLAAPLILGSTGCVMQAPAPTPMPVAVPVVAPPPKPTVLSPEAEEALTAAEQRVIEARVKRSLWIPAVEHLNKAREAAKRFDSDATILHAREVIALCALSIAQLESPPVRW